MLVNELPEWVFCTHPTDDRKVILIIRGESGYLPIETRKTAQKARDEASMLNGSTQPSKEQVNAMLTGSMFGWTVPGVANWTQINPKGEKK